MTEAELIKACKAKKPKAQALLYELYADKLMGICMRYGNRRADAEDIFQEAFIKVFNSIHKLKKNDSLGAWIKRIVVNTAINHYHKNKKYQEHVNPESIGDIEENTSYNDIIERLNNEELLKLINQLASGYRMVFNLYVIEGYSHKEIAKMLGTNTSNTKVQLYKAKKALKKMMVQLNITEEDVRNK